MGLLSSYDTAITGYEYLLKSKTLRKSDTVDRLLEIRSALSNLSGTRGHARATALIDRIDHILDGLKPVVYESAPFSDSDSMTDVCLTTVIFSGALAAFATYCYHATRA